MISRSQTIMEIGRDAVVLIGGVVLVLATPWIKTEGNPEVTGALLIYGLLLAGTALWAMNGASRPSHWVHLVVGVLVLAAPWMLQFPAAYELPNFIAVIVGITATLAGLWGVLAARRIPRQNSDKQKSPYLAW